MAKTCCPGSYFTCGTSCPAEPFGDPLWRRRPRSPTGFDDGQWRRHEAYFYGDKDTRVLPVEHGGQILRVLFPETVPPTVVWKTALSPSGDLLFLVGEEEDDEDIEGNVIEGGEGVAMIAKRHIEREDTYWILAYHNLYAETLDHFEG